MDITKSVTDEALFLHDPKGHMLDLPEWNEYLAHDLAHDEGLELTEEHWDVIYFLRDKYREYGHEITARMLLKGLEEQFQGDGGRRHLFQLFPKGPVKQGSRIAGLPEPLHASDPSFGSVH
jgi:tRNA 2-thiouridine synthesizing protein E